MRRNEERTSEVEFLSYADGTKYIGDHNKGVPHGWGTQTWANGDSYVGQFEDGKLNGYGKWVVVTPDGTLVAEGQFRDGLPDGVGRLVRPNGTVLSGQFAATRLNGEGTLVSPDGTRYVGQFKDNMFDGCGTLTNAERGFEYVGDFQKHQMHGQGRLKIEDDLLYEGEFENGLKHGRGTETRSDGSQYIGEFKEHARDGAGVFTYAGGARYEGSFKKDYFDGQGVYTHPDGFSYAGEWRESQPHGHGTRVATDGTRYVGEFKDGMKDGWGYETGTISDEKTAFVGEWKSDEAISGHVRLVDGPILGFIEVKNDEFQENKSPIRRLNQMLVVSYWWLVGLGWFAVAALWSSIWFNFDLPVRELWGLLVLPMLVVWPANVLLRKVEARQADRLFGVCENQAGQIKKPLAHRLMSAAADVTRWPAVVAWVGAVAISFDLIAEWLGHDIFPREVSSAFLVLYAIVWLLSYVLKKVETRQAGRLSQGIDPLSGA